MTLSIKTLALGLPLILMSCKLPSDPESPPPKPCARAAWEASPPPALNDDAGVHVLTACILDYKTQLQICGYRNGDSCILVKYVAETDMWEGKRSKCSEDEAPTVDPYEETL